VIRRKPGRHTQKSQCKICGGASICHNKRRKSKFKECDGSRYASITVQGISARYAGAPASATTSVKRASARSATGQRYASITAYGAIARYAGAPASATTTVSRASARSVAGWRCVSITAEEARARYAGARASATTTVSSTAARSASQAMIEIESIRDFDTPVVWPFYVFKELCMQLKEKSS
jgi:hypothetical protein